VAALGKDEGSITREDLIKALNHWIEAERDYWMKLTSRIDITDEDLHYLKNRVDSLHKNYQDTRDAYQHRRRGK